MGALLSVSFLIEHFMFEEVGNPRGTTALSSLPGTMNSLSTEPYFDPYHCILYCTPRQHKNVYARFNDLLVISLKMATGI